MLTAVLGFVSKPGSSLTFWSIHLRSATFKFTYLCSIAYNKINHNPVNLEYFSAVHYLSLFLSLSLSLSFSLSLSQCWDWTQGLIHAKQMFYHWVIPSPCLGFFQINTIHTIWFDLNPLMILIMVWSFSLITFFLKMIIVANVANVRII
jgi:hypothetical protein